MSPMCSGVHLPRCLPAQVSTCPGVYLPRCIGQYFCSDELNQGLLRPWMYLVCDAHALLFLCFTFCSTDENECLRM